jgi:CubicO group peptidase (beta-lactamase class C family)
VTTLASKIADIQAALDTLARQHKIPGASLGVLDGSELVTFATGVANKNTGVPVTPNTLFQIGSNTKVYTATLVMQLVDEGLVDLDSPVKKYIKDFDLKDKKARDSITVRNLLTHTSGIEGDYFEEFGRGDDGIELYVASLKDIGQIYAPNEMWSYCNSGWTVLGLLIERLREKPYAQVLRENILTPIGATKTTVLMEEMLAHSCAVGHMTPPGQSEPMVVPRVVMSPSHAPAGSMTSSTPAEVLAFVRMHLNDGRARDGAQVLSAKGVKAMQQPQVKLPMSSLGGEMGLGWILGNWDGERVIGHGGGTIGQTSFLHALPDRPFAFCLLTNAANGGALFRDLARYVFNELTGVHTPEIQRAPDVAPKLDLKKYTGRYSRLGIDIEIKLKEGKLSAEITASGPLAGVAPPTVAHCIDFDKQGRPNYVHVGGRVSKRVAEAKPASKKPATKKTRRSK